MTLPELLWRRYSGMESTYLSIAGSSSHAFTRVNDAQGSACATRMVGVVGVVGSLLFAMDEVSAVKLISTCRLRSKRRHEPTRWRNSRFISHRRLWLGWRCGRRQRVNKNPGGFRLLSFPREDSLGLLAWRRRSPLRHLVPHVPGRAWVSLGRDEGGSVRRHLVTMRRHIRRLRP